MLAVNNYIAGGVESERQGALYYYVVSMIAIIYFFFNSSLLPHGLLYTTILAPAFYLWLTFRNERWVVFKYIFVAVPFAAFSLFYSEKEIDYFFFLRSMILYFLIYVSVYAFAMLVKENRAQDTFFERLIQINFVACVLAVLIRSTEFGDQLWVFGEVSKNIDGISRLKLLTYEPSYYSILMVPLVVYSIAGFLYKTGRYYQNLLYTATPLMLSFSFGVIACLVIAVGISGLAKIREFKGINLLGITAVASVFVTAVVLVPDNAVATRFENIWFWEDSSGDVRISQSNDVALRIMDATSLLWGSGFGQAKLSALGFFDEYWGGGSSILNG